MKKIGIADYYLDEFHANHFPAWIAGSKHANSFEIIGAYAETNKPNGLTTDEWCEKNNIKRYVSLQQLVTDSDCIIVLAPDEAHSHERLSEAALKAKKPVFIDKVLADDLESAKKICTNAERYAAPMYSSSALRFFKELDSIEPEKLKGNYIEHLSILGAASFEVYIVHQIEMLVRLCGAKIKRIMNVGSFDTPVLLADLGDATATLTVMGKIPFAASVAFKDKTACFIPECTEFFPLSVDAMLEFFLTGNSPSSFSESLCVVSAHEAAHKARKAPFEWVSLQQYK